MRETSHLLQAGWTALLIGVLLSAAGGALGQEGSNDAKVRAADREAVTACLKIAADNAKRGGGVQGADAPTGDRIDAKALMTAKANNPANLTPQAASAL
jgi:hypothetical protein